MQPRHLHKWPEAYPQPQNHVTVRQREYGSLLGAAARCSKQIAARIQLQAPDAAALLHMTTPTSRCSVRSQPDPAGVSGECSALRCTALSCSPPVSKQVTIHSPRSRVGCC